MTRLRLKLVQVLIPILSLLVLGRLFYWQIIRRPQLSTKASSQHSDIVSIDAHRGSILSNDGSILAGTENRYLLYAYTPHVEKPADQISEEISPILADDNLPATSSAQVVPLDKRVEQTQEYLKQRLSMDRSWIALKHHLTIDQKESIEKLDIKGLGFQPQTIRYYPEASMSASILGFVGKDNSGHPQGYFGLEGYYDRQLQGRSGQLIQETDAQGNPILVGRYQNITSRNGRDLVTTINRSFQYQVEKLLKKGIERYGAKQGTVLIMNSKTGALLSMASVPSYDPRIFYQYDQSLYKNPAVANLFEPGSIFKPLVMAAALDANKIKPDTECDICSQPLRIGKYTIKTWNEEYNPNTTMTETIVNSDNTGMVFVARKLGAKDLHYYLEKYGFGSKTDIDLQEEVSGSLSDPGDMGQIEIATTSFGQGIAVTRIQLLTAINALANDGRMVSPYLVQSIRTSGEEVSVKQSQSKQVISKQASKQIKEMMIAAVEDGSAKWARPENIKIAGKTGTAQIPIAGHYDEEKTIASFVGFFPADDPKYTMLVTLREPQTSPWGSETAAPLWFDIARNLVLLSD